MTRRNKPPLFVVDPAQPNRADELIAEAAETEAVRFVEEFGMIKDRCESPIEELLMAAMFRTAKLGDPFYTTHFFGTNRPDQNPAFPNAAFVYQQVPVGQYRVDIMIHDATGSGVSRWIVVECDGHDFHEKTKAQARRDKQRDRYLQSLGCRVLRFTGSEIWADPEACVDEIFEQFSSNESLRERNRDK